MKKLTVILEPVGFDLGEGEPGEENYRPATLENASVVIVGDNAVILRAPLTHLFALEKFTGSNGGCFVFELEGQFLARGHQTVFL